MNDAAGVVRVHSIVTWRVGPWAALLVTCVVGASRAQPVADTLRVEVAARFAQLALDCVQREYPNKIAHVLSSDADVLPPRQLTSPPSGVVQKEIKSKLLLVCRRGFSDESLTWIDAAYVLTAGGVQFPPLLGTGGNDGRLEFTNNVMQRLVEMIDPGSGEPTDNSASLCQAALWSLPTEGLQRDLPIGQFLPGSAGGANAGPGYDAQSLVNPWDFILLMEGALSFGAAVCRRMQVAEPGVLSAPFTVRPSLAGYASAAPGDKTKVRPEIWLPLWERPATASELRMLFSEGRSQVGRRSSRDGVDFARAIATLGVDRGISSFQRMGFIKRNGQAYLATPLGRWPVLARPEVNLVDDLDRWLDRSRQAALAPRSPASLGRSLRQIETAILGVCRYAGASYIGTLVFGDLIVVDYCEPLIDSATWEAVQRRLKQHASHRNLTDPGSRSHPRRAASRYLLSSLAYCARCGSPLYGLTAPKYDRYACTRAHRRRDCDLRPIPRLVLEDAVISTLREYILQPDVQLANQQLIQAQQADRIKHIDAQKADLSKRLSSVRRKLANTTAAIAEAGHSQALLDALARLEAEAGDLTAQIAELDRKMTAPVPDYDPDGLTTLRANLDNTHPEMLHRLLAGLVSRIIIDRDGSLVTGELIYFSPPI